jgi:hypothetical protein
VFVGSSPSLPSLVWMQPTGVVKFMPKPPTILKLLAGSRYDFTLGGCPNFETFSKMFSKNRPRAGRYLCLRGPPAPSPLQEGPRAAARLYVSHRKSRY